jgi:ribose 5-phosphate isomerase B
MGNYQYDPLDDYPDFAKKVAQAVLQNPKDFLGIVICGSGVGVSIVVNRFKGIRCALGFSSKQVKHAKENDHINVLALASDYLKNGNGENGNGLDLVKKIVDTFIETKPKMEEKYLRRIKKIDEEE